MVDGLRDTAVRGEPVVHGHHALIRDHVAGYSTADADGVETFPVAQAIDHRLTRFIALQPAENLTCAVDRVGALPRARTVRAFAFNPDLDSDSSLTTSLDHPVAGFHHDGEICPQNVRIVLREPSQTVVDRGYFLAVVEDESNSMPGYRKVVREFQCDGQATLHVASSEAV